MGGGELHEFVLGDWKGEGSYRGTEVWDIRMKPVCGGLEMTG